MTDKLGPPTSTDWWQKCQSLRAELHQATEGWAIAQEEVNRLRAALEEYRSRHKCAHQVMCWADQRAAEALGSDKAS